MTEFSGHHQAQIDGAHTRLNGHEVRINQLERDGAVAAEREKHIQKSLTNIESSIGRVGWLVITAIVGGAMAFIINGGLNNVQ